MAQTATRKKTKTKLKTRLSPKRKLKIPKRKTAKKTTPKKPAAKKKPIKKARPAAKKVVKKAQARVAPVVSTPRISVGDWAPTFTMPDQYGNPISLTEYRGKKVVLYFYPKDDTPGCTKEACSFKDHLPSFEGADAVILGVSFDGQESHQKFIEKYQLNFKLLSDLNREVADQYGVYVDKNMYGNITKGIERSTFVIDREGRVSAVFRRVSVDGHTQEVLEALSKIS